MMILSVSVCLCLLLSTRLLSQKKCSHLRCPITDCKQLPVDITQSLADVALP